MGRTPDPGSDRLARLLVLTETGAATFLLGPNEEILVGRHPDCEIRIGLPSMSRRHARIVAGSPHEPPTIEDLGGMNGVQVRGHPIATHVPVAIGPGDIIELGGAMVVLHAPAPAAGQAIRLRSAGAVARAAGHRSIDDPMRMLDRLIEVVAGSELGVVLLGESGVGKTVVAEAIHALSHRARHPRHRFDCGPLGRGDPDLALGQLFGARDKPGLLEAAAGGTVILRDVVALPLAIQDRLTEVITTHRAERLEGGPSYPVDVRFIAVSPRDLLSATLEGELRRPFFDALGGLSIVLPPLRERAGEIPRFAARFLAEAAARVGRPRPRLSNDALGLLIRHPFAGNLRELRTLMDRACALAGAGFIGGEHLMFEAVDGGGLSMQTATTRRFTPIAPTEPPASPTEPISVVIPAAPRAIPEPAADAPQVPAPPASPDKRTPVARAKPVRPPRKR